MKTQKEILECLVEKTGLKKTEVENVLNAYEDILQDDLFETGSCKVLKFGKIEIVKRAERTGRNPKTKEVITIPEKLAPRFGASTFLKQVALRSVALKSKENNKENK